MANLTTYVTVDLDGKEYLLKFDYNSACDLEEMFGKGIAAILHEEQIGFRLVRGFYWAGLKWKKHGLTLDETGKMLGKELQENGKNIAELMKPVMDALKKSKLLGTGKDDEQDDEEEENEEESRVSDHPKE